MRNVDRVKKSGIAVISLLTILNADVSQASSRYAIAGIGSTSCGQYLKPPSSTKEISDIIMVTWIQGYLSGTNTQRLINTKTEMKLQPDSESIVAFVDKFCRDNPLKTVYEATISLDLTY